MYDQSACIYLTHDERMTVKNSHETSKITKSTYITGLFGTRFRVHMKVASK